MARKPPPRIRGFEYLGFYRYFLTICTFNRIHAFDREPTVRMATMQLSRTADERGIEVIAYCFMPDHAHVLMQGKYASADFREFVRLFKRRSSYEWKRTHRTMLWQRSYFEHVLRDDEDTIAVARYILENPVRAGLVTQIEDYPYLGSMTASIRDLLYSV